MAKSTPRVLVNQKTLKKDLLKKAKPERPNFTFRFEGTLLNSFRKKAESEGYSATQVLEALMRSYLDK